MKHKWYSRLAAAALVLTFLIGYTAPISAIEMAQETASGSAKTSAYTKSEIVYANLNTDGTVEDVYVVNQFATTGGQIADSGDYTAVKNLTDTSPLDYANGRVTANAASGNFYYQGTLASQKLPWVFDIGYKLDGKEMNASSIAGQSGKLTVNLKSSQNTVIDSTFYEHYMLQISFTVSADKFANIGADGATVASAGSNRMVSFTVMPGRDADITLTADVTDFAMGGIEISAVPFAMDFDLGDMGEMLSEFDQLIDAIDALHSGVGDLVTGVDKLDAGVGDMYGGSAAFYTGLSRLSQESAALQSGSAQMRQGLETMVAMMEQSGEIDLSMLTALPAGLNQMAAGLEGISGGLTQLKTGFQTGYGALDNAFENMPDVIITGDDFDALYDAVSDPDLQALVDSLRGYYGAGQTLRGTYAQVKSAFDSVGTTLDTLAGNLNTIRQNLQFTANSLEDALGDLDIINNLSALTQGLSAMAANYKKFDSGLAEYLGGVRELAGGYAAMHAGILELSGGTGELLGGVQTLYNGTGLLNSEIGSMPDQIDVMIDEWMTAFTGGDFDPVSFTSAENEVDFVQFVFTTAEVSVPENLPEGGEPEAELSFWDRVLALFGLGKNKN